MTESFDRIFLSNNRGRAPGDSTYALNIAGVYQDNITRSWAVQTCDRAAQLAGEEHIHNTWHDVSDLMDPSNLQLAVHAAQSADVIVVSIHATQELPLELCVWAELWLPRRRSRVGALTALVGVTSPLEFQSVRTIRYLESLARKARLDFFPRECKCPAVSGDPLLQQAFVTPSLFDEISARNYDPYHHWGLNE